MNREWTMVVMVVMAGWVSVGAGEVLAAQLVVDPGGGGTHVTIQSAIVDAANGDEIVVLPSVYVESIDFLGKSIRVRSTSPQDEAVRDQTIIRVGGMGTVVTFASGETSAAILEGFTVRDGDAVVDGGGIACMNNASPTLRYNRVVSNFALFDGGGIFVGEGCSPRIEHNVITGNICNGRGAGVYATMGAPVIQKNVIDGNQAGCSAGGGVYLAGVQGSTVLMGNTISRNFSRLGGGISVNGSDIRIERNRIVGNYSIPRAGGISLSNSDVEIVSNFISGNRSEIASAIDCVQSDPSIRCNTFVGNWSTDAAGMLFIGGSQATLSGNIISHMRAGVAIQALAGGSVSASYNNFFANAAGDTSGTVTMLDGNTFVDPQIECVGQWQFGGIQEDPDEEPPCFDVFRRGFVANFFGPGSVGGFVHYRIRPDRERFDVGLTGFPPGQHAVAINGVVVAQVFVNGGGNGNLEFDTNDGNFPGNFPEVFAGDLVSVGSVVEQRLLPSIVGTGDIWRPGDEHLRIDSVLIDQSPGGLHPQDLVDIDGQPRVFGVAADIGADEFVPPGSGDADSDGDVDFADARLLQLCTTAAGENLVDVMCVMADLDGDADVDRDDWSMWLDVFTGPQ
jgi:Periplasmic copper-binding protein (NosD)